MNHCSSGLPSDSEDSGNGGPGGKRGKPANSARARPDAPRRDAQHAQHAQQPSRDPPSRSAATASRGGKRDSKREPAKKRRRSSGSEVSALSGGKSGATKKRRRAEKSSSEDSSEDSDESRAKNGKSRGQKPAANGADRSRPTSSRASPDPGVPKPPPKDIDAPNGTTSQLPPSLGRSRQGHVIRRKRFCEEDWWSSDTEDSEVPDEAAAIAAVKKLVAGRKGSFDSDAEDTSKPRKSGRGRGAAGGGGRRGNKSDSDSSDASDSDSSAKNGFGGKVVKPLGGSQALGGGQEKDKRAGKIERRVDSADGQMYTLADFIDAYGGTEEKPPREWTRAVYTAFWFKV